MSLFHDCPLGEKKEYEIPIADKKGLRVVVFQGKTEGKTLVVTTGVHGCEYVGVEAVKQVMEELEPKQLNGQVIFLPLINEEGFYQGVKRIVPEDGLNLNNSFAGEENGTYTKRLAYAIERHIYKEADLLIDLHGGDVNETMTPLVFFPVAAGEVVEKEVRKALKELSITYCVQSYAKNGLYSYATQCGVPAILIERGGGGRWSSEEVDACKQNIYEMLAYLNIMPLSKERQAIRENHEPSKEIVEACYEEAKEDGFFYCTKKPYETVKEGELLGEVQDKKGKVLQQCVATYDGVVLYYTHALGVKKGDALIAYGKVKGE